MLNHISIMGRLVAEPELRSTRGGTTVTTIRIACDRDFSADGKKEVDFIDCTAWRQKAEFICRNFHKGEPMLLDGRLEIRGWTDTDGKKHTVPEIRINEVYFCGGRKREEGTHSAPPQFTDVDNDDDLPFDMSDDELPL